MLYERERGADENVSSTRVPPPSIAGETRPVYADPDPMNAQRGANHGRAYAVINLPDRSAAMRGVGFTFIIIWNRPAVMPITTAACQARS